MRKLLLCLTAAFAVTACATPSTPGRGPTGTAAQSPLTAAVSDSARPAADAALDQYRRPVEVLAFAGVRPGWKVADLIPGNGYYTRILAKAVGQSGRVFAYVPDELTKLANREPAVNAIAADPAYGNVTVVLDTLPKFNAPEKLDAIMVAGTYHYMHARILGPANMDVVNGRLFDALKPGGVLVIVEAVAEPGSGVRDVETRNRIDPAVVRSELMKAGFTFEGESSILRTTVDTYKTNALDPAQAGQVDQFVYKFRKPRAGR